MPAIRIINEATHYTSRHGDPNDQWDGDDTGTHNDIRGFEVIEDSEKRYSDLDVGFELDKDVYYLLYCVYSTGDSFSHQEGCIEYVGLYKTFEDARVNQERIERHAAKHGSHWRYEVPEDLKELQDFEVVDKYNEKGSPFSIKLISPSGNEFEMHVPWNGYFERLTEARVDPIHRMSRSAIKHRRY